MGVKESRGGRYGKLTDASGYYGNADAGQKHRATSKDYGDARKFIGSGDQAFVFYMPGGGTAIIRADSYADAWRQAKVRGYRTRRGRRR